MWLGERRALVASTPGGRDKSKPWEERQAEAADHYADLAGAARELTAQKIRDGDARGAQAAATTAAICQDKASLLSGGVTSRSESRSLNITAAADRIRELVDRLPPAAQALVIPSRALNGAPSGVDGDV
jgi:hypothetical protein